jgi:proline iminopeptidase
MTRQNMTVALCVEDLESLRRDLGQERLLLVGHSWGGMLAMAYAAAHPDRVDRLILIGPGGPTTEFFQWFNDSVNGRMYPEDRAVQEYWVSAAKHGVDGEKANLEAIRALTPAYFFDRAKGLAFAQQLHDGSLHALTFSLLESDFNRPEYDSRAGLRELRRPAIIIQGHQDPIGQKTAEEIHSLIRDSILRYIPRSGHFPWLEQPEQFRSAVAEFLKEK